MYMNPYRFSLRRQIILSLLLSVLVPPSGYARVASASDFGVIPDRGNVITEEIQAAVESAKTSGCNVLIFQPGDYVTGSITLPSGIEIRLEKGARILGSVNPYDYKGYSGSSHMDALISSQDTHGVRISGEGTIDGRGLELALAIDSLHHTGERPDPKYNKRRMRPSLRPKLLDFKNVDGLDIEGVNLRSSAAWGLSLDACCNVVIRDITFENRAYWNNDGIDIADCRNVLVERCDINSADDGIVLKSFDSGGGNDGVVIRDCEIRSSASAVKFGTESFGGFRNVEIRNIRVRDTYRSAIALETVDGAHVENVLVDGVEALNTGNPIFMRLGHRRGERPGSFRNVTVRNLSCVVPFGRPDEDYDLRGPDVNVIHNPFPSSITGLPDARIENVTLENIDITYPGRGTKGMGYIGKYRVSDVPEMRDAYPEFSMFGELPAWGLYVRHVDGITLKNVKMRVAAPDYRDALVADDVTGLEGIVE